MTRDDFEAAWARFQSENDGYNTNTAIIEYGVKSMIRAAFNAGFRAAIDAMNAESDRRDRRAGDPK
jgi:hypothetical protein